MNRRLTCSLVIALAAAPGLAQSWKGPASIRLEVEAYRGGAIAGAEVILRTDRQGASGGPQPVYTDGSGEVEVTGLAQGDWRVEIAHPSHMTFVATLRVEAGERAVAISTAHQAGQGSGGPMKVKIQRPKGKPAGVVDPPEWARDRQAAPAPAPPMVRPEPAPASPPAPPGTPAPAAAPEASAPPVPEPVPEPVPAPTAPAEPTPSEPMPREPMPTEPMSREPLPSEPPPSEPMPSEPMPREPAPSAQPVPAAAPAPTAPVAAAWNPGEWVRAAGPGGCLDCKPGEWSVVVEVVAAASGGDCADAVARGQSIASSTTPDLASYAGPAVDPGAPWDAVDAGPGRCVVAAVAIPAGARYLGYSFGARDTTGGGGCLPKKDCGIGNAQWDGDPRRVDLGGGQVFWAVFENRGPIERVGELKVWFAPPSTEWRPGSPGE